MLVAGEYGDCITDTANMSHLFCCLPDDEGSAMISSYIISNLVLHPVFVLCLLVFRFLFLFIPSMQHKQCRRHQIHYSGETRHHEILNEKNQAQAHLLQ